MAFVFRTYVFTLLPYYFSVKTIDLSLYENVISSKSISKSSLVIENLKISM